MDDEKQIGSSLNKMGTNVSKDLLCHSSRPQWPVESLLYGNTFVLNFTKDQMAKLIKPEI